MEPQRLIGQPMYTDDHCGRHVGLLEQPAPLRDFLTVTGEDDCFGRVRWNVHRDPPSTVVLEYLGDKLSLHGLVFIFITLELQNIDYESPTAAEFLPRFSPYFSPLI